LRDRRHGLRERRVFRLGGCVERAPEVGRVEIPCEPGEPLAVHKDFATFETMPVSIGLGFGNAVVYPSWRDAMREFIVEDCLEGGNDLKCVNRFV
jgi:hypothetical protein